MTKVSAFEDWIASIGNAALPVAGYVKHDRVVGMAPDYNLSSLTPPVASSSAAAATMRANRRRDTKPELLLRSALHRQGWRFRVDALVDVSGRRVRPDIVFSRRRVAVFIDGCFWHSCPEHGQKPKTNAAYWESKLNSNKARDLADSHALQRDGWKVVRIWEHDKIDDAVEAVESVLESV